MLKFKMILEAIDRASAPVRRVRSSMSGLAQDHRRLAAAERLGEMTGRRLRASLGAMAGGFRRAGMAARAAAGRAGLAAWTKATELAKRGTLGLAGKLGSLVGGMARWGATAAAAGAGFALFDMFRDASAMEQFAIELEDITGSARKAGEEMAWLKRQSIAVPIRELTDAYVQLRRAGIDPTAASLKAIADEAVKSKKPIAEVVEALTSAKAGDFGGLQGLKIKTATKGAMVTFSWLDKQGKRASKSVRNSAEEIERALIGIFDSQAAGAADRFGNSFAGLMARLRDGWTRFQLMIADAGIFDLVKTKLAQILAWVDRLAKNGQLQVWAEQVSDWLEKAFTWAVKFTEDGGWQRVGEDIKAVATVVGALATALQNAYKWYQLFKGVNDGANNWYGLGGAPAGGPAPEMSPQERRQRWKNRPRGVPGATPKDRLAAPPSPWRAPPRPAPKGPFRTSANDAQVGGLIRIKLEAAPGTSARTAAISSDNPRVPIQVELGRTMQGAA